MVEPDSKFCSTRNALSEMLQTASRKLERTLRLTPAAQTRDAQSALEQAKTAVADLTARLANHRDLHGC